MTSNKSIQKYFGGKKKRKKNKSVKPSGVAGNKMDSEYLTWRSASCVARGYTKPKWIEFCEILIDCGFDVWMCPARHTRSKYIFVVGEGKVFKVRFSDHRPNPIQETKRDSDFYVGVSNFGVTTTEDAIAAVISFYEQQEEEEQVEQRIDVPYETEKAEE